MKKRALSVVLSLCFLLSACGTQEPANTAVTSASLTSAQTQEVQTSPVVGEMRDISSMELVSEMGIGWNLGNTLDVCNADRNGDGRVDEHSDNVDEMLWGNPCATRELFEALKEDGISSVRIPVTWRDHTDENFVIDADWLDRVQEVVDYAYDLDMYVIINLHHDGGGDPDFGAWIIETAQKDYDAFYARYSAVWKQICARFENYSDKLIFESMNEVGFDGLAQAKGYELLTRINQDFVDTVRGSGGNNPKRHLLIAGYWTDIERSCASGFMMPEDPENRLILSVHYYTPWQFCTTNIQNEWGTPAEVRQMETLIGKLDTTFVQNGIPVIIGEYAASGNDKASCVLFIEMLVRLCTGYGIATYYWDNGGQVNRSTYEWRTPEFLEAMKRGILS